MTTTFLFGRVTGRSGREVTGPVRHVWVAMAIVLVAGRADRGDLPQDGHSTAVPRSRLELPVPPSASGRPGVCRPGPDPPASHHQQPMPAGAMSQNGPRPLAWHILKVRPTIGQKEYDLSVLQTKRLHLAAAEEANPAIALRIYKVKALDDLEQYRRSARRSRRSANLLQWTIIVGSVTATSLTSADTASSGSLQSFRTPVLDVEELRSDLDASVAQDLRDPYEGTAL